MATSVHPEGLARVTAVPELEDLVELTGTGHEPIGEPVVLIVLPALPRRCPRWGHRMTEDATECLACRALGLWPRLDRRKLARAAPDLERIARLAEQRTIYDIETIKGMLTRSRPR